MFTPCPSERSRVVADRVEAFVRDVIAPYERDPRAGRDGIADLDFYIAFNMFRFAAILHGIKGRVARGTAASADARAMGERFARVADLAWEQALRVERAD